MLRWPACSRRVFCSHGKQPKQQVSVRASTLELSSALGTDNAAGFITAIHRSADVEYLRAGNGMEPALAM